MTTKLFLANRADLAKLDGPNPPGLITVHVIPISAWTPGSATHWVVVGTDPSDAAFGAEYPEPS